LSSSDAKRKTIVMGEYGRAYHYAKDHDLGHVEVCTPRVQSILGHRDTDFILVGDPVMPYSKAIALHEALTIAELHGCTVKVI
jgi:hypothetical protein